MSASYSLGYCRADSRGHKHMFSVQVATGDVCQGHGSMLVLPPKPGAGGHVTYDSASDNPSNPVMYVIFHDSQAYPAYHIIFQWYRNGQYSTEIAKLCNHSCLYIFPRPALDLKAFQESSAVCFKSFVQFKILDCDTSYRNYYTLCKCIMFEHVWCLAILLFWYEILIL